MKSLGEKNKTNSFMFLLHPFLENNIFNDKVKVNIVERIISGLMNGRG